MQPTRITLPEEYNYVLLIVLTICFQTTMIGFIKGGGARKENFHYEMLEPFDKEHKKAFGPTSEVSKQGYPDMGSGRYSKNFSYKEWYDFNMAQTQHA